MEEQGSAGVSALVVATRLDEDHQEIQYLGSIPALSSRDVIVANGTWSADSHAAALGKIKRLFADMEEGETEELPKQRRRIKGLESSREVSVGTI